MKTCKHCGATKTDDEMLRNSKNGHTIAICKACENERCRIKRHKQYLRDRDDEVRKQAERREWLRARLSESGCAVCGKKSGVRLDTHHLDPSTKEYSVSLMGMMSTVNIENELRKCVVLCASHHAGIHWILKGHKSLDTQLMQYATSLGIVPNAPPPKAIC